MARCPSRRPAKPTNTHRVNAWQAEGEAQLTTEKAYEKHAWILLFAFGVLFVVMAVPLLLGVDLDTTTEERIIGRTFSELRASDPRFFDLVTFLFRLGGLAALGFAVLIIAISVTAFRRGEKWAWYALWSLPAFGIGFIAIGLSAGEPLSSFLFLGLLLVLILPLLGLLLPYRKFFPKS